MPLFFAQRVTVPAPVLVRALDGESVLLNLNSERYFGLDEVGTRLWDALTTSESIQAAYNALLAEYEVDAERLRQDLHDFITTLGGVPTVSAQKTTIRLQVFVFVGCIEEIFRWRLFSQYTSPRV